MLFSCLLLATAIAMATLWAAISTTRHNLATAADLTALSAAQSLASGTADPCTTAHRIATTHQVRLTSCQATADTVTIQVAKQLTLPAVGSPTLTAQARAGPT